jgi:hypothetical protein
MVKAKGNLYTLPASKIRGEGKSESERGCLSTRNRWMASVRPVMEGVVVTRSTNVWLVPVVDVRES